MTGGAPGRIQVASGDRWRTGEAAGGVGGGPHGQREVGGQQALARGEDHHTIVGLHVHLVVLKVVAHLKETGGGASLSGVKRLVKGLTRARRLRWSLETAAKKGI